jgi:hypothetical protein
MFLDIRGDDYSPYWFEHLDPVLLATVEELGDCLRVDSLRVRAGNIPVDNDRVHHSPEAGKLPAQAPFPKVE